MGGTSTTDGLRSWTAVTVDKDKAATSYTTPCRLGRCMKIQ